MNKTMARFLARLSKGIVLLFLLSMIFSAIRRFGHEVLEVGILYEGSIQVQYEFGDECVLDAIAASAALIPLILHLVARRERLEHRAAVRNARAMFAVREARRGNASAFPVAGCFLQALTSEHAARLALSDEKINDVKIYRDKAFPTGLFL